MLVSFSERYSNRTLVNSVPLIPESISFVFAINMSMGSCRQKILENSLKEKERSRKSYIEIWKILSIIYDCEPVKRYSL